ncbi:type I polyketide synthase [Dendronalium sp. ChiSLP03b]|uniref:type I polyketide synthase n=1 Tax=Dendronalium sp. ChiSLP03b TaxID=3075381 RepID=UPI002AD5916E|nr:type I polyketide synthase [Dendronalium sp. ChiSLP03b]MDZ8203902.1 type I polyketide synthase [Dendronalium sp. ChiSLP03b]
MEPIAIIGIGCRFPKAKNPESFWQLLRNGVDAITEVPPERWDINAFYEPQPAIPGKMNTRWGGFLEQIDRFDPSFFGISAREAEHMDPQQRLVLEVAWEALENAGLVPATLAGSQTGVFIGITNADYHKLLYKDSYRLSAYSATGTTPCITANRLSYVLNLRGPSIAIDTACSSSLVAVHLACQSLRNRESNLCLVGGVNLMVSPEPTITCSQAQMMAADGRCKTFDASADGYVRGEGCGVIVLKRLADALHDGDNILALIKSSAVNQDGTSNGLTAPNGPSQQAVIRQALELAGVTPAQISYVEAHGTGTSLGDPIEVKSLKAVLMEGRSSDQTCWIGSLKTNIGHSEGAAGVAGLIKVVLQLQQGEIAPHLHLKQLNPYISLEGTPFSIPLECQPWSCSSSRLAGVSAFSFGGTNCHIILEEAPLLIPAISKVDRPRQILTLSAKTAPALVELAKEYADFLTSHPKVSLGDVCFTAKTKRSHFEHRLAVDSKTTEQLCQQLSAFAAGEHTSHLVTGQVSKRKPPKIAFLFTGQGSQYLGMGRQLYETQPTFRQALDQCAEILHPYLQQPLLEVLYPQEEQSSPLDETAYTQPALFALEYALFRLWESWGIKPEAVMGHSVGEYAAACVAGVFSLEDGLKLIAERARLMQALPQDGEMLVVFADEATVAKIIQPYSQNLAIAAINGPKNIVISGATQAVEAVSKILKVQAIASKKLRVSHAFHSPLMEPMLKFFEQVAKEITYSSPQITLISNVTGQPIADEIANPEYWCRHIRQSVNFAASMEALYQKGFKVFLEIGPQPILLGMGRYCLPEGVSAWLPSLRSGCEDWQQLLESLGTLYVSGVAVDWTGFDRDYLRQQMALPTYPFQRQRYWMENSENGHLTQQNVQTTIVNLLHQGDSQKLAQYVKTATELSAQEIELLPKLLEVLVKQHQRQLSTASIKDWLYEIKWQPKPRKLTEIGLQESGSWLILADIGGVGQALAHLLQERGQSSFLVYAGDTYQVKEPGTWSLNPSNPSHFERLLQEIAETRHLPLRGVVHLWSLDTGLIAELTTSSLEKIQILGCGSTLNLIQAIAARSWHLPRLWLVTREAVPGFSSSLGVAQASLWGLGKVIALEHPEFWGGLVDLAADNPADAAVNLLTEIFDSQGENQIAFRQKQRYVARLGTSQLPEAQTVSLQYDCTYLITGGLGALGLKVAQWMVEHGARNLLLTGRTGASSQIQEAIACLEHLGAKIIVARADVANYDDMARMFEQIQTAMPPLRGIIHTAGVLDDGILLQQDWNRFVKVMSPKVNGAWNLHVLSEEIPLDFFICFSSAASLLGSPGQGNYAAANAFMDALAHYRQNLGLPGLSINWGPWENTGMAASLDNRDRARLAAQGMESIPLEQGMQILGNLLTPNAAQVGVLPINWSKFLEKFPTAVPSFLESFKVGSEQPATQQPAFLQQLKAAPASDRRNLLITHICTEVARLLGLDSPEQVDIQQGLLDLGIDSLMAVELRKFLQSSLGYSIPATLAFDYPTIAALGDYLVREVMKAEFSDESATTLDNSNHQQPNVVESNLDRLSDGEAEALLLSKLDSMRY